MTRRSTAGRVQHFPSGSDPDSGGEEKEQGLGLGLGWGLDWERSEQWL